MKRILKRISIALIGMAVLYFGATALAFRSYWAGLFWNTYLSWLPIYDVIESPKHALAKRAQYRAAEAFIRERMLTPSTAKFCSIDEAKFGSDEDRRRVMVGWVDAQNPFGAMIRQHFTVVFLKDSGAEVDYVRWAGEGGQVWR